MTTVMNETANRELSITRLLNAPPELVWEVWTKPEHIANWWGPVGFTTTTHEMNVKPGGVWRFMMHGPDGRDYPNKIVFIEVVKPERLVYNHTGEEETENVRFHVTVTFEKQGNKTKLTMRSLFESEEELIRVMKEYGAEEGMKQTVDRLEEYLENEQSAHLIDGVIVIERNYNAPINKVWKAISDKNEIKKWFFDLSDFKPEPGFEFQFYGVGKQGQKFLHLCKVIEVINQKKLSYSWQYDGYEGISFVSFELFPEGNKTRVKLSHKGLETFPVTAHKDFANENFIEGWTHFIGTRLKEYVEKANK